MNRHSNLYKMVKQTVFAVLLSIVLVGCGGMPDREEQEIGSSEYPEQDYPDPSIIEDQDIVYSTPEPDGDEVVVSDEPSIVGGTPIDKDGTEPEIEKPKPALKAEEYDAIIEVTEKIRLGASGTMNVWIGKEKYMPKRNMNTVRDTTSWYTYAGTYARITPRAENFTIEPNEPTIVKIDETGTGAQYTIIPQEKGKFEVSALIELFDNPECEGLPVVKPVQVLSVQVKVDYLDAIWTVVWTNFIRFWGAFVALFFAVLLFVIRKYVKKKTGYSEDKNGKAIEEGKEDDTNKMIEDGGETPNEIEEGYEGGEPGEGEGWEEDEVPNEEYGEENQEP